MRRVCVFFALMVFALPLVLSSETKKPITLRLVTPTPEGDYPQTYRDKELAKRFNERAKGEYMIEVYAGGALAKLPEYFDAVRVGAVDMAFSNWGMFSFLDRRLGLLELPFLFDNNYATNEACKHLLPLYDRIFQERFNAKGLGMMNTGGLNLFSTRPVKRLEDWKGLLVGAVSPPTAMLIKGLGGSPVTIMFFDLYESLQKKVIDAATLSAHGGVVFGLPDVCKHYTVFYGISAFAGYTVNLDVWKKMPRHIQTILEEEAEKSAEWMKKIILGELLDEDLKVMKQKGVSVYVLPKEERERWVRLLAPELEKQLAESGEFGRKVKTIAEEANKKHPYSERGLY